MFLLQKDKVIRFQDVSPFFLGHKYRYDLMLEDVQQLSQNNNRTVFCMYKTNKNRGVKQRALRLRVAARHRHCPNNVCSDCGLSQPCRNVLACRLAPGQV